MVEVGRVHRSRVSIGLASNVKKQSMKMMMRVRFARNRLREYREKKRHGLEPLSPFANATKAAMVLDEGKHLPCGVQGHSVDGDSQLVTRTGPNYRCTFG